MAKTIQAIKGMNDILPVDSGRWEAFESTVKEVLFAYGYRNIRMPIVEQTDLFVRSIGEVTDIVEKEMYTFTDRLNGDSLTMRPEGTASCLRAVLEHNLLYDGPQKVWYSGSMFRHERPQKGRYRQFHQFGAEALGLAGPDVDAEQLIMLSDLWQRLGLTGLQLELNTLGDVDSRAAHRESLIRYLEKHEELLDEEAKRRLHTNPLRILDTKNPAMQDMVNAAPKLMDYINEDGLKHFEQLQKYLKEAGISYQLNSRLVRGLDYYNLTVFEWVTTQLGAQGTVCGGGRYDGLIGQLGGKAAPACGFGMGVERLLLLLEAQSVALNIRQLDVYLVHQGTLATPFAWQVAQQLRAKGFSVQQHLGESSFKSQMKKADQSGARFAIIIGDNEAEASKVTLKSLRIEQPQQLVGLEELHQLLAN